MVQSGSVERRPGVQAREGEAVSNHGREPVTVSDVLGGMLLAVGFVAGLAVCGAFPVLMEDLLGEEGASADPRDLPGAWVQGPGPAWAELAPAWPEGMERTMDAADPHRDLRLRVGCDGAGDPLSVVLVSLPKAAEEAEFYFRPSGGKTEMSRGTGKDLVPMAKSREVIEVMSARGARTMMVTSPETITYGVRFPIDGFRRVLEHPSIVRCVMPDLTPTLWTFRRSTSVMDDTPELVAVVKALLPVQDWLGVTHIPELSVRCVNNRTSVWFHPGAAVQNGSIRIRLDDGSPRRLGGAVNTTQDGIRLPRPISLVQEMQGHAMLVVEWNNFRVGATPTTFPLLGIEEVVSEVRRACNW